MVGSNQPRWILVKHTLIFILPVDDVIIHMRSDTGLSLRTWRRYTLRPRRLTAGLRWCSLLCQNFQRQIHHRQRLGGGRYGNASPWWRTTVPIVAQLRTKRPIVASGAASAG